jgi:hypothetical protein
MANKPPRPRLAAHDRTLASHGASAGGGSSGTWTIQGADGKTVFDSDRDGGDPDIWTTSPNGSQSTINVQLQAWF